MVVFREWALNLEPNVMGHSIDIVVRFRREIWQLSPTIIEWQILGYIELTDIFYEDCIDTVLAWFTKHTKNSRILGSIRNGLATYEQNLIRSDLQRAQSI